MENEPKSYQIPTETMPGIELAHHLADLVEIQNFIKGRGIETRNTRIERYIEYFRFVTAQDTTNPSMVFKNSTEVPFESPADWKLYVLREVHELMWILKGLKVHLPLGIDEKLKIIVGGSDFAALDGDSLSRNTQFELRIASYFCQAGCEVDLSTETDVIALTDEQAFYLECKRVGNHNQLDKRLSEARKQLQARMPEKIGKRIAFGCIAADVTKIAFSHNGLTWGMTNEHSRDIVQEKLIGIGNAAEQMSLFRSGQNLLSYWLQIHIPALIIRPYPPTTATRFSSYHIFSESLCRKGRRATLVYRHIFESASKEDTRSTPGQKLTRRTIFTFPKETTFSLDEDLFREYLEHGEVTERDINEEVGTITINGRNHTFSFFDFRATLDGITKERRNALPEDPNQLRILLVMQMYAQRFPYEMTESDL